MEEENEVVVKSKNVFAYKNYVLTFLGALVSNLGNILYNFAVSFYILQLTGNNAFIQGLYLAVAGITYVLVALFGGVIGDRFHKGKIMYICDYAKGFGLIAFTLLLMFLIKEDNAKVIVLFVIAVLSNAIAAIFSPTASSLLPHIVPEESIQQAQSYNSVMTSSLSILGIILAGVLYSLIPINVLFLIVGGLYVLSGVSEMFIKYEHKKPEERLTVKTVFSDIGSGFKYIFNFKPMFYLLVCILFVNFFFAPISSNFLPYFIVTDIATSDYMMKDVLSPEMWNSIFSVAFAVGMIIMGIIYSAKKQKESIIKGYRISFLIFIGILAMVTGFYFLFIYNVIHINVLLSVFLACFFLLGLTIITINVPASTKVLTTVDKDKLGKVNSVVDVGSQGLIPLSNLLAGLIISGIGSSYLLVICTGGLALMVVFLFVNKQVAKL